MEVVLHRSQTQQMLQSHSASEVDLSSMLEYLAALATQTEPVTILRSARRTIPSPLGSNGS